MCDQKLRNHAHLQAYSDSNKTIRIRFLSTAIKKNTRIVIMFETAGYVFSKPPTKVHYISVNPPFNY